MPISPERAVCFFNVANIWVMYAVAKRNQRHIAPEHSPMTGVQLFVRFLPKPFKFWFVISTGLSVGAGILAIIVRR